MPVKANHRAIKDYHARLLEFSAQQVHHEGAARLAFQSLLSDTAMKRDGLLERIDRAAPGGRVLSALSFLLCPSCFKAGRVWLAAHCELSVLGTEMT